MAAQDTIEQNKAIVRRYQELYNSNELESLDEIVAADLISHNLVPGMPQGLASGKRVHMGMLAAFPNFHVTIEDLVGEGDKVVARITMSGTHTGTEFLGLPAGGKQFKIAGISIFRVASGKIIEHWGVGDTLSLMQQLKIA